MKKLKIVMLVAVIVAISAGSAFAAPAGPYRLAFTTSVTHDALSTDIGVYNDFVQGLADDAGIGMGSGLGDGDTSWFVIGSTDTVDARDNTGTNPFDGVGVPIYLVDGTTQVASDNADLWDGEIAHIIDQDENGGADYMHLWIYTGTNLDGTSTTGLYHGPLGNLASAEASQGNGTSTIQWIWRSQTAEVKETPLNMYAMSEIIPEPATMCLLGLGGLAMLRRRR